MKIFSFHPKKKMEIAVYTSKNGISLGELRHQITKNLKDLEDYVEIMEHNLYLKKTNPEKYKFWENDENGEIESKWVSDTREQLVKYSNQYEEMCIENIDELMEFENAIWQINYGLSYDVSFKYDSPEYEERRNAF